MEKENKSYFFVQFIHPGGEHRPDNDNIKNWNTANHKRKFLKNKGHYICNNGINEGEVVFWGEWEPESKVLQKIENPISNYPHFIYEPYYVARNSYQKLQNTDPFVFGEQLHYTVCQQNTKRGPTQLRNLARGSVILFGSCLKQSFVLDTVFVVDCWIDHNRNNYKKVLTGKISETYWESTIFPLHKGSCAKSEPSKGVGFMEYRLYFGATFCNRNRINGMFSFFPCLPYNKNSKGFERPVIKIKDVISDNLTQGKKYTCQNDIGEVEKLWNNVKKQVTDKGLMLGVFTELPEKRNKN